MTNRSEQIIIPYTLTANQRSGLACDLIQPMISQYFELSSQSEARIDQVLSVIWIYIIP